MTEEELDDLELVPPKKLHFEWLLPVLIRPRSTFEKVAKQNNSVWLTPMLVLSILLVILALVSSPIRAMNSQMGAELPPDFEYYPPEQQQAIVEGQQSMSGPVFTLVFPLLGSLAELWIGWLVLGSILHLTLTFFGSRSRTKSALNITAWASMPFVIRYLVQIIAILVTRQLIASPGLSGFFATDMGGFRLFLSLFFGLIDLYTIWHVILLVLGVKTVSNLTSSKAWASVLLAVVVMFLIQSGFGLLGSKLGNTGGARPFFFF